jgi:hypothetical protein
LQLQAIQDEEPGNFTWVGCTSRYFDNFAPGDVIYMDVWADFQFPGCYNLNKFLLKVNDNAKDLPKHLHQILIS